MSNLHDTFNVLVGKALQNEGLRKYELKFCGGNEKGEGYIGDITFVDVFGEKNDGTQANYSLVLKVGGKNKTLKPLVRLGFEREIYVYAKVIPAFWKLQNENSMAPFSSIPKCYLSILTDSQEVLVLQNIKSLGFKLHDRRAVMNLDHIKLIMKVLGQWHALSFALSFKKPEEFKKLTGDWISVAMKMFVNSHIGTWIDVAYEHLFHVLKESGELEVLREYREKTKCQSAKSILREILCMEESQVVVTHGDCWNNNLMFKYKANNEADVLEAAILDFQISIMASPVIDLSYFIYAVTSEHELDHFQEMLETYYDSLSQYLLQLGCDPQEIFPYSDLEIHWKKYAAYGAVISPLTVCFNLVDKDDVTNFGDKDLKYEQTLQIVEQKHRELFWPRLVAVAKHFINCEL